MSASSLGGKNTFDFNAAFVASLSVFEMIFHDIFQLKRWSPLQLSSPLQSLLQGALQHHQLHFQRLIGQYLRLSSAFAALI